MYYEEKLIGGVLMFRLDPDAEWQVKEDYDPFAELTRLRTIAAEYEALRAAVVENLEADHELAKFQLSRDKSDVTGRIKATVRAIESSQKLRELTKGGE